MHGFEEAKSAVFQCLDILVLLVARRLIRLLEVIDEGLEVCLQLLHFALLLLDAHLALVSTECLELFNLFLLRIVAEVQVGGAARRSEAVSKFLKCFEVPASLVILQVVWVTMLDGWKSTYTNLVALRFACRSAVEVSNHNALRVFELSHQFVPSGFHVLAVSSPGSLKLDEYSLPGNGIVPSFLCKLCSACAHCQHKSDECALHLCVLVFLY